MSTSNLELRFKNSLDKIVTIRIANPRADITSEEVNAAMDTMLANPVFSGNAYFINQKIGARIVTRAVEDITI